jgi:hypothetical protein
MRPSEVKRAHLSLVDKPSWTFYTRFKEMSIWQSETSKMRTSANTRVVFACLVVVLEISSSQIGSKVLPYNILGRVSKSGDKLQIYSSY